MSREIFNQVLASVLNPCTLPKLHDRHESYNHARLSPSRRHRIPSAPRDVPHAAAGRLNFFRGFSARYPRFDSQSRMRYSQGLGV